MEDDQKNPKWKTTKQQPNTIQFKNKIAQTGCGSAPGNLVLINIVPKTIIYILKLQTVII